MNHSRLLLALLFGTSALAAQHEEPAPKPVNSLPFAWPFLQPEEMAYRGGTTQGTEVTLDTTPSPEWTALHKDGYTPFEHDRRAILAMAGQFRVSFQFVETIGFTENYTPPRPYFSWGTEEVRLLEDRDHFISLQHTLVMFFKNEKGEVEGPGVMKHWRQDWTYQDTDLHTYRGDSTWERLTRNKDTVAGTWTQAVYQVDDSPRYEVVGTWDHSSGVSTWNSESSWRPLPRREFSVRKDYNVLDGTHQLTITPTGWVHAQDNRKLLVEDGKPPKCLAAETGINRYERITAPDLKTGADDYWNKTGPYWQEVRSAWADIYKKQNRFHLQASYKDQKLYQHHFAYAAKLEEQDNYNPKAGRKHARSTIKKFLGD
ncbi:MAG: hypothetical protein O3A92_15465 [Verrucomicrobia bacterium]|nr:hypothetical protein [Verrucomicrobiota bacterium]